VDFAALQRDPGDGNGFGGGARCEDCRAAVAVVVAAAAGAAAGSGEAELAVAGCESGSWAPLGTGYDPPSDRAGRRGRDGGGRETRTSCLFAGVVDMLFLPAFAPGHGRYLVVVRYVLVRPCLKHNVPVAVRLAPGVATHICQQHLSLGSTPEPVPQPHRYHHTHYYRRQSKKVAPAHQVKVLCARHLLQPASDGGVDDSHTEDAEGSADPKGDKAYTNVRAYNIDDPMRRQRCDSEHNQKRQHVLLVVLDLACPLVHERLPPRQGQQRGPKCRRNEIAERCPGCHAEACKRQRDGDTPYRTTQDRQVHGSRKGKTLASCGEPRLSKGKERERGNVQEVGNDIADNDAIGVDVAVLFEQIVERLELVKRGWDAKQRSVGSGEEK
jgi:hypothetical protein